MGNSRNLNAQADTTYRDFMNKVMMYVDNELSRDEERQLLREIQQNPHYQQILGRERSFREFIRTKVSRRSVSPNLVQSIKAQIKLPPPHEM